MADPSINTLSYGLSSGTTLHVKGDLFYLLLSYPLKVISLHSLWREPLQAMARVSATHGASMSLEQLKALLPEIPVEKISSFFDQLVYKGFLTRKGSQGLDRYPKVSVIVPVRNRPGEIAMCLTALTSLDYSADQLEIIVVDDASTDRTPDVAAKFPVHLIRLKQHKRASFCRNLGAERASGEILAFIDSDCIAHPRWLLELVPMFGDSTLAAVGGRIDTYHPQKKLDFYEQAESSLMVTPYAKQSQKSDPFFYVPACNFLIRREVFLNLKGFNVDLSVGEDVDLCWRLQDADHRLAFRPEGVVYHKHRNQLPAFCIRRFQYGTSEPLLQKMHPKREKRFLVPPPALAVWMSLVLLVVSGSLLFFACAVVVALADVVAKRKRFSRYAIHPLHLAFAAIRGYGAFGYHVCAFVSRYYLWTTPFWLLLFPPIGLGVIFMHLLHTAVEFRLKKPWLNIFWFVLLFTLEQMSYQLGVWWACIQQRVFRPVLPKIVTEID